MTKKQIIADVLKVMEQGSITGPVMHEEREYRESLGRLVERVLDNVPSFALVKRWKIECAKASNQLREADGQDS